MKSIIVGTAGHIDHGKSALVRALTGTDPDRLEEEKRRGITIDIGFATLDLGSSEDGSEDGPETGYRLGFVDVPGHERFVKNMLAGVGGIDLVLLVVAADESIQPQTREHFDICRLLEIPRGIVVLTKTDLVDQDALELVKLEIEEFVSGSFLEGAPVVAVSSRTGQGMELLREMLRQAAAEVPAKDPTRHFRLPIDRVFLMKGFGTVITGTLVSGQVRKESELEAYPAGKHVRVRGIQVHSRPVEVAMAGQRTALNLSGPEAGELTRGVTLADPGRFVATRRIDSALEMLDTAPTLKNGAQVHFHTGTAEVIATAVCLEPPRGTQTEKRVEAGERAYVQFRLREPVLMLPGDRFIIRKLSPLLTIGGGRVLDNWVPAHLNPSRAPRSPRPMTRGDELQHLQILETGSREQILAELLRRSPTRSLGMEDLIARTGWLPGECHDTVLELQRRGEAAVLAVTPLQVAQMEHLRELRASVVETLERFHRANPLLPGAPLEAIRATALKGALAPVGEEVLRRLVEENQAVITGETIRLVSHHIVLKEEEAEAKQQIARAFAQAGLTAPSVQQVLAKLPIERRRSEKILQMLVQEGVLVRVSDELTFHAEALGKLRRRLTQYKSQSDRISVSAFKDLAEVSRKYAIPLLEYLDRERVTRRAGDERILL